MQRNTHTHTRTRKSIEFNRPKGARYDAIAYLFWFSFASPVPFCNARGTRNLTPVYLLRGAVPIVPLCGLLRPGPNTHTGRCSFLHTPVIKLGCTLQILMNVGAGCEWRFLLIFCVAFSLSFVRPVINDAEKIIPLSTRIIRATAGLAMMFAMRWTNEFRFI